MTIDTVEDALAYIKDNWDVAVARGDSHANTVRHIAQRLQTTTDPQTMLDAITHLRRVEAWPRPLTDTHTVIMPSGTGAEMSATIAQLMAERDDAIRQLDNATKTAHDMLKARQDRIALLEAECERQGATIKEQDKKVAALESEMQDAAGLRAELDKYRQRVGNQAAFLQQIGAALGAEQFPPHGYTSSSCLAAIRTMNAEIETCHDQMRKKDDAANDALNERNIAMAEAFNLRTEANELHKRITALRAENADLRAQRLAEPTADALKAIAADTLDIVRTFHGESAQPGESLARYVARNVETLRAALRTVLLPLTLLTHHRGQFRPEDGLLERLAKLARRPQA